MTAQCIFNRNISGHKQRTFNFPQRKKKDCSRSTENSTVNNSILYILRTTLEGSLQKQNE
jgi:hypothetical protein